jgi:SpoVK/Ycf46/Vps4 family AAA+-type ATPase
MLCFGPPGNGKSRLSSKLAKSKLFECVFADSATALFDRYVGKTEKKIRGYFEKAKQQPHKMFAMFLDEVDVLCETRGGQQDGAGHKKDFQSQFLASFGGPDSNNMFVFAATNFKEKLDSAILRWGRISFHILLPELTEPKRHTFLQMYQDSALISKVCQLIHTNLCSLIFCIY